MYCVYIYPYICLYMDTMYMIHVYIAKPLAGLKRLASFGAWGGGVVHDWCKPGVWPFFVHRLAGVGKPLFWCQISIFW